MCRPDTGRKTKISRVRTLLSSCSVIQHACACGQVNHSAFCHFKPFAFLHLICDGALTCSSILLQWRQYHRNQDVGRLGVTSNVHGNDLKKHIFSTSRRSVSCCPFTSPLVLGNSTEAPGTNCAVDGRCSRKKPHGPSTFPTVCVVSMPG